MKADRGRPLVVFEVAEDGVAGVLFDLIEGIALGEDRMPQRAGGEPAFRGLFHEKHDLAHQSRSHGAIAVEGGHGRLISLILADTLKDAQQAVAR